MTVVHDNLEKTEAKMSAKDVSVFYGDKKDQEVGVGWMEISSAAEAADFADLLRATARPFDKNKASISGPPNCPGGRLMPWMISSPGWAPSGRASQLGLGHCLAGAITPLIVSIEYGRLISAVAHLRDCP